MNGSFVASTAASVGFEDDVNFSARNPEAPPLLTVSAPTGLQFQRPGPIKYEAERAFASLGLRVTAGQTLALLGGELAFQGANLSAIRGRLDLGSVAAGQVHISSSDQGWQFDYSDIQAFESFTADLSFISAGTEFENSLLTSNEQGEGIVIYAGDITLSNSTLIFANTFTDISAGNVTVNAQRLTLSSGSVISSRAVAVTENDIRGNSGNVIVNASESITLEGAAGDGSFVTSTAISNDIRGEYFESFGQFTAGRVFGNGGTIIINTPRLKVTGGATVASASTSVGDAGNIIINAPESVEISGLFIGENSFIISDINSSSNGGTGNGGPILINTGRLSITDSAQLSSRSVTDGAGSNIEVNADVIEVMGSAIAPAVEDSPSRELPSAVTASAAGRGDAGQILLNAARVIVRDGGAITTATAVDSNGNGNILQVQATEQIVIEGVSAVDGIPSGFFSSTEGTGNAGQLIVQTDELTIAEGGIISAATLAELGQTSSPERRVGQGISAIAPTNVTETPQVSGGLDLDVNRLILDNGNLSVETFAQRGSGAELNISGIELLVLTNDSLLSAEAVNSANGGNITLDATDGFVIALVDTNSDILARANEGDGGEIEIVARSIFGLEERLAISGNSTNDIDASSRFGSSGTVALNQLEVNPVPEAAELTEQLETPEVSQSCNPSQQVSSLILTGRGGIPPAPQARVPELLWHPSDRGDDTAAQPTSQPASISSEESDGATPLLKEYRPISEAQGWQRNASGQIILTTLHPTPTPQTPTTVPSCSPV